MGDIKTTNLSWYSKYCVQLNLLHELGFYSEFNGYVCPLCLKEFDKDHISLLTREDAPQESLGGHKVALTCCECNNGLGLSIDCHLSNYIERIENSKFPVGHTQNIIVNSTSGIQIRGTIDVCKDAVKLIVPPQINNPKELDSELPKWVKNTVLDVSMRVNPNKCIPCCIIAALIKNAFIILFSYLGYTLVLNPYYNRLREQLFNPDKNILPEGLFHINTRLASDGVYVVNNEDLRGFFVQFSLIKNKEHPCAVFIPSPAISWEDATERLKRIKPGDSIKVIPLMPSESFFDDVNVLKHVSEWLSSTTISW